MTIIRTFGFFAAGSAFASPVLQTVATKIRTLHSVPDRNRSFVFIMIPSEYSSSCQHPGCSGHKTSPFYFIKNVNVYKIRA
jgi:hypothetical protein